ncbi:ArsR/SmtB family transcription factor [Streptomyces celluloflavus]|uniref:ArsR/SmtB family transcription factor n=1 Tax=Streptomyces celluloflavus TaxID=58344 RepID=UPI0036760BA4
MTTDDHDPDAATLAQAAAVFRLLSSPVRLHLAWLLSTREHSVTELAERVGASLPTVSRHLATMQRAGQVRSRPRDRHRLYTAADPGLLAVVRHVIPHPPHHRPPHPGPPAATETDGRDRTEVATETETDGRDGGGGGEDG